MARLPAQTPTFWPINRRAWLDRAVSSQCLSVSGETGLSLGARRDGPLSLNWPDGSLGGLVLPVGMALDEEGKLYLLDLDKPWRIRRYYTGAKRFRPLPGLGGPGDDPRQFDEPANIAIRGHNLYVADSGHRRMTVFDLGTLALRHFWDEPRWAPVDVAAGPRRVWLLTGAGAVYSHRPGDDWPAPAFSLPGDPARWRRIMVDREESIYALAADGPALHVFSPEGESLGVVRDAGDVRVRFDPPPVRLFFNGKSGAPSAPGAGYFHLPPTMAVDCLSPAEPLLFDRRGRLAHLDPADLAEYPAYLNWGVWIGGPLDSDIYRCQWHRLTLDMDWLPPGARVVISTLSADEPAEAPAQEHPLWAEGFRLAGSLWPSGNIEQPADFLVQSRPGQYLWLKIVLEGDGFGSPRLRGLETHFPRQSYLDYLPAVFSADEESRSFLERFLSIFQTEWEELEQRIANLAIYFDPETVPGGPFLQELARWLALPLEETWDDEQQRNLLRLVGQFYPLRGTAAGLRLFVQAYLQNMTGLRPEEQGNFPQFLESFRQRNNLFLADAGHGPAAPVLQPLWSPAIVNRLQADSHARAGEARLVATNDPPRDLFHTSAHRFQVYLPAGWVRSADDESMLRRALDAEKPAHTAYELRLVAARFRVGVQSTVGIDTILGGIPSARLACAAEMKDAAPCGPPRHRLGYDMVLAGRAVSGPPLPFQTNRL